MAYRLVGTAIRSSKLCQFGCKQYATRSFATSLGECSTLGSFEDYANSGRVKDAREVVQVLRAMARKMSRNNCEDCLRSKATTTLLEKLKRESLATQSPKLVIDVVSSLAFMVLKGKLYSSDAPPAVQSTAYVIFKAIESNAIVLDDDQLPQVLARLLKLGLPSDAARAFVGVSALKFAPQCSVKAKTAYLSTAGRVGCEADVLNCIVESLAKASHSMESQDIFPVLLALQGAGAKNGRIQRRCQELAKEGSLRQSDIKRMRALLSLT